VHICIIESSLLNFTGVKRAIAAGSFRRMKETVGDIDYLVVAEDSEKVIKSLNIV
jgi:DNA polymerase (family 10)